MQNKKKVIFIIIIIILGGIFLAFFTGGKKNNPLDTFLIPTRYEENRNSNDPGSEEQFGNPEDIGKQNQQDAAYGLIEKVPSVGNNFALYYNFSEHLFILYINPSNKQAGNDEFNAFIKSNGVEDRSWIENLFITYILPSPSLTQQKNTAVTPAP